LAAARTSRAKSPSLDSSGRHGPARQLTGGGYYSGAFAVSGNGNVVAGDSDSTNGREAFRWTAGGGMTPLGDLPGGAFTSLATAANYDGSVIVSVGTTTTSGAAFFWDAEHGMRSLKDALNQLGVDTTGWDLRAAKAISDDGNTIAGWGQYNGVDQVFVATVPEPEPASASAAAVALATALLAGVRMRRTRRRN
jgi:probable HAF family extracellular repeat protein